MTIDGDDVIDVFLQPGEYFVGDRGFRVRTLLGSCVSITLWEPRLRIGGMSHFLLPGRGERGQPDPRYAQDAMQLVLAELAHYGVDARACQAKLFGGGEMFLQRRCGAASVGRRNGHAARELLAACGIGLMAESLFGAGHRQIIFEIGSGDVWSRQLPPHGNHT